MNNSPPAPLVHISLFSGIGGFELAAAQVGWINAASCEINDFGHKILSYHFQHSYHHRDVKTLTYKIINEELTKRFGPNWRSNGIILSGGFPCQGFSVAGQRLGTDDDRYLWPEYLRLIDEINPDWVCGENVTGILSMEDKSGVYRDVFAKVENRKITRFHQIDYYEAIYTRQSKMLVNSICESIEERGYEVQTFAIPAASVEAPHKRERIWFIAHSKSAGSNREKGNVCETNGRQRAAQLPEFEQSNSRYDIAGISSNSTNSGQSRSGRGSERIKGNENNKAIWRNILGETERLRDVGFTANPISNDAGRYRHGQTGQAPRFGKVVKEERQRLRTVIERIGGEADAANSKETISEHSLQTGARRARITRSNSANGIHANSSSTGRQKQFIPDFAAKSGYSGWGDNEGERKRFGNFPTQSPVCGGNDGIPNGLDGITFSKWRNESIKGFGNAVVPQVVIEIFSAIEKYRIFTPSP